MKQSIAQFFGLLLLLLVSINGSLSEFLNVQNITVPITYFASETSADGCGCGKYSCGLPNREQRVLGGEVTEKVEYPWLAYLTYRGKLYCGGSLINDRYLISAAHCVHSVNKGKVIVHLGKHHRISSKDTQQIFKVKSWWAHPKFNRRTFENDISVIKIESPVKLNKYVRPICFSTQEGNYEGKLGTVAGWGRTTEKGISSQYPREIKVPIMSNSDCKTKKYKPYEITSDMFCAGYDQGKIDACQGDSGGPLMLDVRGARGQLHYELAGIVSWGQGCGRVGYPGVYTKVVNYLDFVKKHVEPGCFCN